MKQLSVENLKAHNVDEFSIDFVRVFKLEDCDLSDISVYGDMHALMRNIFNQLCDAKTLNTVTRKIIEDDGFEHHYNCANIKLYQKDEGGELRNTLDGFGNIIRQTYGDDVYSDYWETPTFYHVDRFVRLENGTMENRRSVRYSKATGKVISKTWNGSISFLNDIMELEYNNETTRVHTYYEPSKGFNVDADTGRLLTMFRMDADKTEYTAEVVYDEDGVGHYDSRGRVTGKYVRSFTVYSYTHPEFIGKVKEHGLLTEYFDDLYFIMIEKDGNGEDTYVRVFNKDFEKVLVKSGDRIMNHIIRNSAGQLLRSVKGGEEHYVKQYSDKGVLQKVYRKGNIYINAVRPHPHRSVKWKNTQITLSDGRVYGTCALQCLMRIFKK